MKKILVVGGSAMDVIAKSHHLVLEKDSNPGEIVFSPGGVGRNIAVNLKRLGENVFFLSVFGTDSFSQKVTEELLELGFDLSLSPTSSEPFPTFVSIHQPNGELVNAVSDFTMLESLTYDAIKDSLSKIGSIDIAVFDSNVSVQTIQAFLEHYPDCFVCLDGVSQTKVKHVQSVLPYVHLVKLNQKELSSLLEKKADDVILAVKELISRGTKQVIVTNGQEPITYNIGRSIYQTVIFEPSRNVSTLGCGDALFAGTIYGLANGKSMHEALNYGKNAASLTMEVQAATHPELSISRLTHDL